MSDAESNQENIEMDRIRQLAELMSEFDLSELSLREGGNTIRLRKGGLVMQQAIATAPQTAAQAAPPASVETEAVEEDPNIVVIASPMVGTFYARPNPNAEAYVRIGDNVETDTTVCIVEAMKVFNEIPAEVRGQIVAILVDDEEPIEFGKPLFKVDVSK